MCGTGDVSKEDWRPTDQEIAVAVGVMLEFSAEALLSLDCPRHLVEGELTKDFLLICPKLGLEPEVFEKILYWFGYNLEAYLKSGESQRIQAFRDMFFKNKELEGVDEAEKPNVEGSG